MVIVIGLFNTGGYGVGYGESKKAAIDHILKRIEKESWLCRVTRFVEYHRPVVDGKSICELQLYANALIGSKLAQSFCAFAGVL